MEPRHADAAGLDGDTARFYDGGLPGEPTRPATPVALALLGTEQPKFFRLGRRIAYHDRHLGEIVVPADLDAFQTDLVSVPDLFTWLVPKTGGHLFAALIHDGLIGSDPARPSYLITPQHEVTRFEADRVFRDGMADSGTGLIRRWLVWSAVTIGSLYAGDGHKQRAALWYFRAVVSLSIVVVVVCGYLATVDLFDAERRWAGGFALPWMGDRPVLAELAGGIAGAIVIPLVAGLAWGRFRRAGWIAGVSVAVLIHVTAGVLFISLGYRVAEAASARLPAWALRAAGAAAAVAAVATFVTAIVA